MRRPTAVGTAMSSRSRTPILPLAPDVVARIKSTVAITSLNQVIVGLVENSLDAHASLIEVEVHHGRGCCVVEDDGHGIPPAEFSESGGLAKMHHTSKADAAEYSVHGCRGTFLASLTSLSILSISSHHRSYRYPSSITFYQGSSVARSVHRAQDENSALPKHGARVVVRDLFGGLPVRVKQRAALAEDKAQRDRLWEELKRNLVSLTLAWDKPVSIRIKDVSEARFCAFKYPKQLLWGSSPSESGDTDTSFSAAVSVVLVKAGLLAADSQTSWIPASASSRLVTIRGIICRKPAPTKQLQFLSLGVRPFISKAGGAELLDHINKLFSQSGFGSTENAMELGDAEMEQKRKDKRFKANRPTMKELRHRTKGVDRHPMFCLAIRLNDVPHGDECDRLDAGTGSLLRSIHDGLDALITSWLATNNFSPRGSKPPRKHNRRSDQWIPPPSTGGFAPTESSMEKHMHSRPGSGTLSSRGKSAKSISAKNLELENRPKSPFHEYSRIKSGSKSAAKESLYSTPIEGCCPLMTPLQVGEVNNGYSNVTDNISGLESVTAPGDISDLAEDPGNLDESRGPEDEIFVWEDPFSKQKYRLNSRTGQAILGTSQSRRSATAPGNVFTTGQQLHRPITLSRTKTALVDTKNSPGLLGDVLENWQSPIFKATEESIRHAGFDASTTNELAEGFTTTKQIGRAFSEGSISQSSKLSKSALQESVVISQVDSKFILIAMRVENGPSPDVMLVLVDQHATDERIRVENLFDELLASATTQPPIASSLALQSRIQYTLLAPPAVFETTVPEARLFHSNVAHFAEWGILLEVLPTDVNPKAIITVHTVPSVIAERCKLQPTLLISLLRTEAWKLNESGARTAGSQPSKGEDSVVEEPHWLQHIGKCPQGILDMLNSRACRSAIMFNDELSLEECEDLIAKAAKCAFPFQCAHGRPSMVPLIRLGNADDRRIPEEAASPEHHRSFARAYRDWRLD